MVANVVVVAVNVVVVAVAVAVSVAQVLLSHFPAKHKYISIAATADFMKMVTSVYTHTMKTIELSLRAYVAEGTILRKSLVPY